MAEVRRRWGDEETAADKVKKIRPEWLGHLARIPDHRIPKAALFRNFRRESDKARHKCVNERRKPIREQQGATQCLQCTRWFQSRGGLAVHLCVP